LKTVPHASGAFDSCQGLGDVRRLAEATADALARRELRAVGVHYLDLEEIAALVAGCWGVNRVLPGC
jgi:hypothetical protein